MVFNATPRPAPDDRGACRSALPAASRAGLGRRPGGSAARHRRSRRVHRAGPHGGGVPHDRGGGHLRSAGATRRAAAGAARRRRSVLSPSSRAVARRPLSRSRGPAVTLERGRWIPRSFPVAIWSVPVVCSCSTACAPQRGAGQRPAVGAPRTRGRRAAVAGGRAGVRAVRRPLGGGQAGPRGGARRALRDACLRWPRLSAVDRPPARAARALAHPQLAISDLRRVDVPADDALLACGRPCGPRRPVRRRVPRPVHAEMLSQLVCAQRPRSPAPSSASAADGRLRRRRDRDLAAAHEPPPAPGPPAIVGR